MSGPAHEDAMVMIEMMKLRNTPQAAEEGNFVWGDDYIQDYHEFVKKYPMGSKEFGYISSFCGWFETLGALWKHGLLNKELLDDWILVSYPWERVKGFALGFREERGNDRVYEHFEAMARSQG